MIINITPHSGSCCGVGATICVWVAVLFFGRRLHVPPSLPSRAFFRVKRVKHSRQDDVVPTDSLFRLHCRTRIRQLEAEVIGLKTSVAAMEARAASDLSSEQASSIRKMAEAETRHQVSNTGLLLAQHPNYFHRQIFTLFLFCQTLNTCTQLYCCSYKTFDGQGFL